MDPSTTRNLPPTPSLPITIILVGTPGVGKSTFSHNLIQRTASIIPLVRINQDTIDKGHRGTRQQCISAQNVALSNGISCIIDRCNISTDQRRPYIEVSRTHLAPVHCIYFDFDTKESGKRAAEREWHEGGLQGNRAYSVVGMFVKQLQVPSVGKEPGLSSVVTVTTDEESDALVALMIDLNCDMDRVAVAWNSGSEDRKGIKRMNKNRKITTTPTTEEAVHDDRNKKEGNADNVIVIDKEGEEEKPHTEQQPKQKNAFDVLMMNRSKSGSKDLKSPPPKQPSSKATSLQSKHHFPPHPTFSVLQRYLSPPHTPTHLLHHDSICVAVPDAYPKAKTHILVIARDPTKLGPLDLTQATDVDLVRHMRKVGKGLVGNQENIKIGFHASPSLKQLHLHVISTDYNSVCLKKKHHWNSFTKKGFFLDVDEVIEKLEGCGRLEYDVAEKKALLGEGMECPRCGAALASMGEVKSHVVACLDTV